MNVAAVEHQDRRIRRTQTLLARALIVLTLEKGYDAISIRDITERADVGYATFFRHYPDKDALLADVLDVVVEELPGELTRSAYLPGAAEAGMLFHYVQQHSEIVRVLLRASAVRQRVLDMGLEIMLAKHDLPDSDTIPREIVAHYMVSAGLALVEWWLVHDMPYTPERMGEIMHELLGGTSRTAPARPDASVH
jgi:AcrR family transcriptional regulator